MVEAREPSEPTRARRPELSVVIVAYRCRDAVRECLAAIPAAATGIATEVVVVDNASGDGTVEMIAERFPDARVFALDENLGFAAGVNLAAAEARGDYLLLLNPDTIAHEGSLRNLVDFARRHPGHGVYGGRTLDPDGRVNPGSCWGRPTVWSLLCFATMMSTLLKGSRVFDPESLGRWQRDSVREVDVVTGCLLLAPRTVWDELEGFDTRFFMYGEDVDLCLRAAALGYRPIITPDAVITHEIGVSSDTRSDKFVLVFKSKAELVRKHFGPTGRPLGLAFLWIGIAVRRILTPVAGPREKRALWRDLWRARREWLAGYPPAAG